MRRILFVDDEPNVIEGLKRMLHGMRREWEMAFATSGQEALEVRLMALVLVELGSPFCWQVQDAAAAVLEVGEGELQGLPVRDGLVASLREHPRPALDVDDGFAAIPHDTPVRLPGIAVGGEGAAPGQPGEYEDADDFTDLTLGDLPQALFRF